MKNQPLRSSVLYAERMRQTSVWSQCFDTVGWLTERAHSNDSTRSCLWCRPNPEQIQKPRPIEPKQSVHDDQQHSEPFL